MRCELRTRDGRLLGELELAEGVGLADVGRALLDGVAAAVPIAAAPVSPAVAAAGEEPRKAVSA
jgi:hypothetical protein